MAQTPDIRVRLSPEGVNEVVAALRRVQTEGVKAGRAGAQSVGLISSAVAKLRTMLPFISFAAITAGLVATVKGVTDYADAVGKAAQKTGAATETISVLALAGKTAEVEFDELEKILIKTAVAVDDLASGDKKMVAAFSRIGLSIKDLQGLDTGEQFVKIAEAMARFDGQGNKTAAIADILGVKLGPKMMVLLNDLANGGFEEVRKKAEAMGLVISKDLADAAQRANDALTIMGQRTKGLATQFLAGFAPAVASAMESYNQSMQGKGVNAMREFGQTVADVLTDVIFYFQRLPKLVGAVLAILANDLGTLKDIGANIFKLDPDSVKKAVESRLRIRQGIIDEFASDSKKSREELTKAFTPKPFEAKRGGKPGLPEKESADAEKAAQARLAFLRAQLDNELALIQAHAKVLEQRDRDDLENGLKSLQESFAQRRRIIIAALDEELRVLAAKRDLTANAPAKDEADAIRKQQEIAKFETDIEIKRIERRRVEEDLTQQERKAVRDMANERLQLDQRILESQGRRSEAALIALELEIDKIDELLKKQGVADAEREKILRGVADRGQRGIQLEEVRGEGDLAFRALQRERQRIIDQVTTGQIFEFEGEQRIIELEKRRLPGLRAAAEEMRRLAEATGDAFKVQEAEDFAAAVEDIAVSINRAGREMADLKRHTFEALVDNTADFLTRGIDEAKNLRELIRSTLFAITQDLRKFAAQQLARKIWESIFGALKGGAGNGFGLPGSDESAGTVSGGSGFNFASIAGLALKFFGFGLKRGGLVRGYAGGGLLSGPGTGTSDSIAGVIDGRTPVRLSNGEFVVRKAAVDQPGIRQMLEDINSFRTQSIRRIERRVPGYAEGGLVNEGGAGSSGSINGRIEVTAQDGLFTRWINTDSGQRSMVKIVSANKRAFRSALGV